MLRKQIRVDSFLLSEPAIELVRDAAGKWNYADLGGGSGSGSGGGGVALAQLRIEDGRIAVRDLSKSGSRSVYDHIDVTVKDFSPGKAFEATATVRMPAPGKGSLTLEAKGGPLNVPGAPFSGHLAIHEASLGSLAQFLGSTGGHAEIHGTLAGTAEFESVNSLFKVKGTLDVKDADFAGAGGSGVLSLEAQVRGGGSAPDYSGSAGLEHATLKLASLTKPVEIRSARLKFTPKSAAVEGLVCSLGSSTLRGRITAANFTAPQLAFTLDIDKLDVEELQQLTTTGKAGGGGGAPSTGKLAATGTVNVGAIRYGDVVLTQVHSGCTLEDGVLLLNPLTAGVFGGKQSGSVMLDTRVQPPKLAMNTKLESVDADQLLSATTSLEKTLSGLLAAGGDASMTLVPGGNFARTLNGKLSLNLTKGQMRGINLMNEVASLGKFLGYARSGESFTNIVQLAGDVNIRDGVAATDNLQLQIDGGSVAAAGTVNLVDESLNLRLTAVLNRDISQKVGGRQIGGFLTTALANDKGELVIPALVTGTFAKPRFLPDAARVAEMKLKSLLPTTANPALTGGVRSVLNSLAGRQQAAPAEAAPAAAAPGKSLLDVFNSLRSKDDKKQPDKP